MRSLKIEQQDEVYQVRIYKTPKNSFEKRALEVIERANSNEDIRRAGRFAGYTNMREFDPGSG